jgi:hypothetical protein
LSSDQRVILTRGATVGLVFSWAIMAGLAVWLWTTSASVSSLRKTDEIACAFLNADAATRVKQNETTRNTQLSAETVFIRDADKFLAVFAKVPAKKLTPAVIIFRNYIRSERALVAAIRDGSATNLELSQQLAATGLRLADQLHC